MVCSVSGSTLGVKELSILGKLCGLEYYLIFCFEDMNMTLCYAGLVDELLNCAICYVDVSAWQL